MREGVFRKQYRSANKRPTMAAESAVIRARAANADMKMVRFELRMAIIAAMKKVLSPSSDTTIMLQEAIKARLKPAGFTPETNITWSPLPMDCWGGTGSTWGQALAACCCSCKSGCSPVWGGHRACARGLVGQSQPSQSPQRRDGGEKGGVEAGGEAKPTLGRSCQTELD